VGGFTLFIFWVTPALGREGVFFSFSNFVVKKVRQKNSIFLEFFF